MDTVWAEALDEYLTSEEWYSTIGVFIESHCSLFEGEEEVRETIVLLNQFNPSK